jgi:hypothetical protein
MLVVEITVSSENFIDTVNEIGLWLAEERADTPFSTYSGDKVQRQIRMGFADDGEGRRFAARFGGSVLPEGELGHRRCLTGRRSTAAEGIAGAP